MARVKLVINDGDWTYEGRPIITCAIERFGDLSGEELAIDTLTAQIHFDQNEHGYYILSGGGHYICANGDGAYMVCDGIEYMPTNLPRGAKIDVYYEDTFKGTFYLQKVERTSTYFFTLTAQSIIGVVASQTHYGGLYRNVAFSLVLRDILGGIPCTISGALATQKVVGYLPIGTRRDNLHQLLLAFGATTGRDVDGGLYFYIPSDTIINIPDRYVFMDGQSTSSEAVNTVRVFEHSYIETPQDAETVLYDNTDGSPSAEHAFVAFESAPVYDIKATGNLTIEESNVNYAIISGVGTLTGKPYTHTSRAVEKSNIISTSEAATTAEVSDATLVNVLNGENTAERLLKFYASKARLNVSVANRSIEPGARLRVKDPFGETFTGYVDSVRNNYSKLLRTECNVIAGYSPSPAGNRYDSVRILTGSGSVSFPAGTDEIYAILISGGSGGQAGSKGQPPENHHRGENGFGGKGGKAGAAGRVFAGKIQVSANGETFTYSCGVGGAGGIATTDGSDGQALGADGTDTTFGPFSSRNGKSGQPVQNVFYPGSGSLPAYAVNGLDGYDGLDGGEGGRLTVGTQTWINGVTGSNYYSSKLWATGGYGGGCAVGANGGNGGDATGPDHMGNGGDGATPIPGAAPTVYGQGGNGGHGGGGGGGGGVDRDQFYGFDGAPGNGSSGGAGGDGCIIIYYKAVTT